MTMKISWRRITSWILILAMVFTMLPGRITTVHAADGFYTVPKSQLALGANVIPNVLAGNESFLNMYVRTDGKSMNVNSAFITQSTNDISNAGSYLSRVKMGREKNGNGQWGAEFKMTIPEQLRSSSYELRLEAKVKADYHKNVFYNAYNHWDVGYADIYGHQRLTAEKARDGEWQEVSASKTCNNFSWNNWEVTYKVGHEPGAGCECGSSAVTGSTFYIVKTSAPVIKDTYITTDVNGNNKVSGGFSFGNNNSIKAYMVLEFSEDIRFSDNSGEKLTLNLDAYYTKNNQGVDKSILKATLVSMASNKMIFEFNVPRQIGGNNTDIYIDGISGQQSFIGGDFNLVIYDKDGNKFECGNYTVDNYITDLAGNPLNWSGSDKSTGRVYFDNVNPTMTNISMTGNMITNESNGAQDSWDDGKDRSAVFAGVGDWVSFNVSFSEYVKGFDVNNVKAFLTITDQNGAAVDETIKLGADSYRNDTIFFNRLTITESMKNAGTRIVITGFEGLESVTDNYGNALEKGSDYSADLTNVTMAPSQGIYLDVDAPIIATVADTNDLPVTNGVYTPYPSNEGEYFTFPLIISEDVSNTTLANTSQIDTLPAEFAIVMAGGAGDKKAYSWYVDTNKSIDENAVWKNGNTGTTEEEASKNTFYPVHDQINYVHIKLDPNVDYNYSSSLTTNNGVYFEGTIHAYTRDHAGNSSTVAFKVKHQVDTAAPEVELINKVDLRVDYATTKGALMTSFKVSDNYAIKSIKYNWIYTEDGSSETTTAPVTVEMNPANGMTKEYQSGDILREFSFEANGDAGRKGTAKLTVTVEDYTGEFHNLTSEEFSYDFTKTVPVNIVKTGTAQEPLLAPEVYILEPTKKGTDAGAANSRTVMFIKTGKNEDGTYTYWGYDPRDPGKYGDTRFDVNYTPNLDIIADMMSYTYKNGEEINMQAPGFWFSVTGEINDGAGTFETESAGKQVYVSGSDYSALQEVIKNCYGQLEIICVTSSDFDTSNYYYNLYEKHYNFKSATSIVETYTCYLGNNAVYQPTAVAVKDAEGQDAEDKLYYEAGEVPASNLDNVAITIKLENITTGEETMGYDLAQFDETKSWIELHYFGSNSGGYSNYYSDDAIYAWPMVKAHEQTVVIPAGVADQIGWYGIYVVTCNANGTETQTKLDKFFFMDPVTLEMNIDSYYKEYQYTYPSGENEYTQKFTVRNDNGLDQSTDKVIEFALGTGPNAKWNVDTSLYFTRTQRTSAESGFGVQELLKARVYNKADTAYEQNAIWVDANGYGAGDYFQYTPVCVESITKESYGTAESLVLPLYKGDNIICMEVMNTNGIITSKEQVVYVTMPYEGVVFEKNITEVSERTGGIMEVNVEAQLPADVDPVQERYFTYGEDWLADGQSSVLGCTPSPYTNGVFKSAYTFRDDIDKEFWLLDQNGNLYAEHIIIEDIDGEAPFNVTMVDHNQNYDSYDGYVFEFTLTVQDKDGHVNGDEVTITFDKDYSAVLLGLTGEERANNETQVTMSIPINREKDAAGEYIPWESYATNNNGIFRTQLLSEYATDAAEDDQAFSIIVWGTFKHDKEYELYNNSSREVTMTVTALDTNGNIANSSISYDYKGDMHYSLETGSITGEGAFNFYEPLDAEGNLGIYSRMPFSMIHSYGAGPQTEALYEYVYQSGYCTTAPMIQQDGIYTFDVTDLFGEHYELPLTVDVFDNLGIDVSFSETAVVNQDVTVYATATLEGDYITDITGVTESGTPVSGTVDVADPAKASITMPENGTVTVKTYLDKERTVPVLNIDKVLEPAEVVFYTPYGDALTGNETEVDYAVTAQVICDEVLYGTNGTLSYDFPRGSKAGDTYTFTYQDAAGNEGSITAVLPCDISPIPGEYVDETAPQLMVSAYGMRNQKYNFIADVMNPDGTELSKNVNCYAAQEYRMILMIQDESDTKVVIQKPGEAAPTSYSTAESGSAVENVALADNTITISENVVFDLYILDENNNVTALTGVTITGVDKTGVEYYVDYQPGFDEDGLAIVTAIFLPLYEGDELTPITVMDKTLSSRLMQTSQLNPEYDEEHDDPSEKYLYAERYYYVFKDNGAYTFRYRDDIGNQAEVLSQVQSMSTVAAVVENVLWYGTKGNVEPDKSSAVNKDVTADLTMSKAVSEVALYKYNSNAENGLGDVLSADAPIEVSFTAKSVYVTYTDNVDYKIAIQFKAAESGRNGCYVLPEVMCIDKTAPVVTRVSAVSSSNNRSMAITFKTDEATLLPENYAVGYTKEHTWMVTGNQPKELRFSDKAGNITTYNLTDNAGLDVTYLTVDYSAIGNDADATKDAINDLKVDVGEDIYIKTNKKATVKLDDTDQGTVEADIWTKLTLPDTAGVHILQLVDVSTGELFYDNVAAQPKDNIPPEIKLASNSIVLLEGSSVESMMQKIKEGITITDNKDGAIADYTVEGYPNATKAGLFSLTYKAKDADGNQANANRTLYIMKAGTPLLMVNGEAALPYGRTVIRGNNVNLEVTGMDTAGESLVIKWRSGMKTTAQMKHSTTTVQNMEFQVPESGFYTIYVRTQDRMEYVTYLYVEE